MADPDPCADLELIEAEVRRLMAQHAAIIPRGYDTARQRWRLHTQIDQCLDRYALVASFYDTSDDLT